MHTFTATLDIIGVNPFVFLPDTVLEALFEQSGKRKGHIPVKGTINGLPYQQTLVRYAGSWRLYINMVMLKDSPRRIGEVLEVTLEYDPVERVIAPPPVFLAALQANPVAARNFEQQPPSRQHEIVRYLANLKTEAALERNLAKIMANLMGEGTFFGRKLG
jgi:hypothetical protein